MSSNSVPSSPLDRDLEKGDAGRVPEPDTINNPPERPSRPPEDPPGSTARGTRSSVEQHPTSDASRISGVHNSSAAASSSDAARPHPLAKSFPEQARGANVFQSSPVRDPDPAAERLAQNQQPLSSSDFRLLMGIREANSTDELEFPYKLATKGGLFRTIRKSYRDVHHRYRIFNVATYALLALQVIIGAIFIIFGALRHAEIHVAISVLGAISTAIGGALTLMKGQGLPNRLRVARNRLHNVVFEAEELYWDFRSGKAIFFSDIKQLREDYLRVMEEMRRNHPDTWTDAATETAKPVRGKVS